jgi:hypothetical protein
MCIKITENRRLFCSTATETGDLGNYSQMIIYRRAEGFYLFFTGIMGGHNVSLGIYGT